MAYPTRQARRTWTDWAFGSEVRSGKNWSMFFGRIALGFLFLWGGYQKILTQLGGKSATTGFLSGASVAGSPFAGFFNSLAGNGVAESLVVYGELLIGISLLLGVATRLGSISGAVMMLVFTVAMWPIADAAGANPLVDYRVIYGLMFAMFFFLRPGRFLGVDGVLSRTKLVERFPAANWILG